MKKVFCAVLLMAVLLAATAATAYGSGGRTRTVQTSGGNRTVTYIEITLDGSYTVKGLTARQTLGREVGTLTDFANAMSGYMGTDTIMAPINFFASTAPGSPIEGHIRSLGQSVTGAAGTSMNMGFDADNRLIFGDPSHRFGNFRGAQLYDPVTAFFAFPQLIRNGVPTSRDTLLAVGLTPSPDGRVNRGFLGQRADGTLIIGNVSGTTIFELQEIAQAFELVNATNIDGGASASIWRNGTYIMRPGRQLASVMFITNTETPEPPAPPLPTAYPSTHSVFVDGVPIAFRAFRIDGSNFFMLRDIAYVLNGTDSQFEVAWDSARGAISLTTGMAYTVGGEEMAAAGGGTETATPSTAVVYVNGVQATLRAYNIGGNNFFMLRDLGEALGFGVYWESGSVLIVT